MIRRDKKDWDGISIIAASTEDQELFTGRANKGKLPREWNAIPE